MAACREKTRLDALEGKTIMRIPLLGYRSVDHVPFFHILSLFPICGRRTWFCVLGRL